MEIDVLDATCDPRLAFELRSAYGSSPFMKDLVARGEKPTLRIVFEGNGGPWVGGALDSEARKRLAAELAAIRSQPRVVAMDLYGDPTFRDLFAREPDAWLVSGGIDAAVEVRTAEERDAELARRRQQSQPEAQWL